MPERLLLPATKILLDYYHENVIIRVSSQVNKQRKIREIKKIQRNR